MRLSDLKPGDRFAIPFIGKTGELLMVGETGARVRYDGVTEDTIVGTAAGGETPVEIAIRRRAAVITISAGTEVEPLA